MIKSTWMLLSILMVVAVFSAPAAAELEVIGTATYGGSDYNLIYESDLGLVWLDYARSGNRWPQQMKWVAGLNAPGVLTCHLKAGIEVAWEGDWRLPESKDGPRYYGFDGTTTAGFNITTSEMGYLFYVSLGNPGYYDKKGNPRPGWGKSMDQQEWGLKNTGPFENLPPNSYWTGTTCEIASNRAWDFNMYFGSQSNHAFKSSYSYNALAVRPGNIVK